MTLEKAFNKLLEKLTNKGILSGTDLLEIMDLLEGKKKTSKKPDKKKDKKDTPKNKALEKLRQMLE